MGIQKNKFVEEWDGRRKTTEKSFTLSSKNVGWLIGTCMVFPLFVGWWTGKEMETREEYKGKIL